MKEYIMVELENNIKYAVVDMLDYDNKKYFLLAQILNEKDINGEFNIYIYNEINNKFNEIGDELEYNMIKDIFRNRLEDNRNKLIQLYNDIIELKVINIDNYSYTLEKRNGDIINMDIEILGDIKIEVDDYISISESIIKEKIMVRFGPIYTDKIDIIRLIKRYNNYYLQRYYG